MGEISGPALVDELLALIGCQHLDIGGSANLCGIEGKLQPGPLDQGWPGRDGLS